MRTTYVSLYVQLIVKELDERGTKKSWAYHNRVTDILPADR